MKRKLVRKFLAIALLALALDGVLQFQLARMHAKDQTLRLSLRLSALRAFLEKELTSNLLIVQSMADFISVTPGIDAAQFDQFASEALKRRSLLKNITAAPNFIMRFVYPRKGNEAILNLNYRDLPGQWEQAQKAKETGEMVLAGPLRLVQGGIGLISRAPVFVPKDGHRVFWGIVSSVIDVDRLYQYLKKQAKGLDFSIRGADGKGIEGDVFLGDPKLFAPESNALRMEVALPAGKWVIAAVPSAGWSGNPTTSLLIHTLIALLAAVSLYSVYKAAKRNHLLEEVRETLDNAQQIAHLGSWDVNHATGAIWWSGETYRIFGVDPETFVPTLEGFLEMAHPDDREEILASYQQSLQSCGQHGVEHRIIRPDGTIRHVEERWRAVCSAEGTPLRSTGTVLDITDRVKAEEKLKAGEGRMRAMSEASYDALIVIDADDVISFWSPAAERTFGWTREEALGKRMHPLITPEEYHRPAMNGLKFFRKTGKGSVVGTVQEFMAIRKNGERFPVERSVSAFKLGDEYYAVGSLRDITERKRIENEIRDYAGQLSLASQAGGIGVWKWDIRTGELTWDEQMLTLYSVSPGDFSGLYDAWRASVHPDDIEEADRSLRDAAKDNRQWEWEFRIVRPGGEIRHIKAAALTQMDAKGQPVCMIGVNWDVTESRVNEERLRTLASTDGLTGLNNRRRFMELLDREMDRARRYPESFSVIMFDADKFKSINDAYGHDVGDMALTTIAAVSKKIMRDVDIVGRIGGEEFAAGLPATGLEGALLAAERLRAAIASASLDLGDGRMLSFTVSLGVAVMDPSCKKAEDLLKRADTALYAAKRNGRDRVERFSPED